MYAQELMRVEFLLEIGDAVIHRPGPPAGGREGELVAGEKMGDAGQVEQLHPLAGARGDAIRIAGLPRAQRLGQLFHHLAKIRRARRRSAQPIEFRERALELPPVHRLEQVVDGVHLEGLERVLIEGGREND